MASLLYSKYADSTGSKSDAAQISWFAPRPFHLLLKGETLNMKSLLVRLYFMLITVGKMRIYYYMQDGEIAHTSMVMPKCYKFPYMEKGSYTIGPCSTKPKFRGRGIYPKVLSYILADRDFSGRLMYMVVSDTNIPSVRGIEKAGFARCGTIQKSKLFKRYFRGEENV